MEIPRLQIDDPSTRQQDEPIFVVRDLLWVDICALLRPVEIDEVRRVLGSTRIDGNEALHQELMALAEILEIFQEQNDNMKKTLKNRPRLPDPPVKKMLERQISFFIQNIRAKSASENDTDDLVPLTTPREREVFSHVLNSSRPGSAREKKLEVAYTEMTPRVDSAEQRWDYVRPASRSGSRPSSRSGSRPCSRSSSRPSSREIGPAVSVVKEVPIRPGSSCGKRAQSAGGVIGAPVASIWDSFAEADSRPPSAHSAPDPLTPVQDSINLEHIEKVAEPLRAALEAEKQALLEDIKFVQECLEEENSTMEQVKKASEATSPTTEELRQVNAKLEKSWLKQENIKDDPLQKAFSKVPSKRPVFSPRSDRPPLKPSPPNMSHLVAGGITTKAGEKGSRPSASAKIVADEYGRTLSQLQPQDSPKHAKKSVTSRLRSTVQDIRDEQYFS